MGSRRIRLRRAFQVEGPGECTNTLRVRAIHVIALDKALHGRHAAVATSGATEEVVEHTEAQRADYERSLLDFLIVASMVFMFAKMVLKEEKVVKK